MNDAAENGFNDSKMAILTWRTKLGQNSLKMPNRQLQALLNENTTQTQRELAMQLIVDQTTFTKRFGDRTNLIWSSIFY